VGGGKLFGGGVCPVGNVLQWISLRVVNYCLVFGCRLILERSDVDGRYVHCALRVYDLHST